MVGLGHPGVALTPPRGDTCQACVVSATRRGAWVITCALLLLVVPRPTWACVQQQQQLWLCMEGALLCCGRSRRCTLHGVV